MAKTDPVEQETKAANTGPAERENKAEPITVGNPEAAASLAIDQSHMEEFACVEEKSPTVESRRPPKGIYFTVRAETTEQWQDRKFYFMLEIEGRDSYLVAPHIAKQKKDEDVIRPVLIVRYVTMAGEEGLWPLKLDPPDSKPNRWNKSALDIMNLAASGKWLRIKKGKSEWLYVPSPVTLKKTPPRFSDRSFDDLINIAYKDRIILTLDHEIWTALDQGSDK
jgi:hypothetical protein